VQRDSGEVVVSGSGPWGPLGSLAAVYHRFLYLIIGNYASDVLNIKVTYTNITIVCTKAARKAKAVHLENHNAS